MVSAIRDVLSQDAGTTLPTDAINWANQLRADVLALYNGILVKGTVGGSADAMTVTLAPAPPAYVDGFTLWIKPPGANTTAPTVNVNSLGNKSIRDRKGNTLAAAAYSGSGLYPITYDFAGGYFRMVFTELELLALTQVLPKNYKDGFTLANNVSDANNDINVADGRARDTSNVVDLIGGALTKQLDALWAAGNNAGAQLQSANLAGTISVTTSNGNVAGSGTSFMTDFHVGDPLTTAGGQCRRVLSITNNTALVCESAFASNETTVTYKRGGRGKNMCYRMFAIYKNADGSVDYAVCGRDVPVDLPVGYSTTKYRIIGVVYTDGSNNNRAFVQVVNRFWFSAAFALEGASFTNLQTTPTQSSIFAISVPASALVLLYFTDTLPASAVDENVGIGNASAPNLKLLEHSSSSVEPTPLAINGRPCFSKWLQVDASSRIAASINPDGTGPISSNATVVAITPQLLGVEMNFALG